MQMGKAINELNVFTVGLVLSSFPLNCSMHFSEYRLREDADPDRAMLLAFELLLARVECDHLLEILEKDQLEPQVSSVLPK